MLNAEILCLQGSKKPVGRGKSGGTPGSGTRGYDGKTTAHGEKGAGADPRGTPSGHKRTGTGGKRAKKGYRKDRNGRKRGRRSEKTRIRKGRNMRPGTVRSVYRRDGTIVSSRWDDCSTATGRLFHRDGTRTRPHAGTCFADPGHAPRRSGPCADRPPTARRPAPRGECRRAARFFRRPRGSVRGECVTFATSAAPVRRGKQSHTHQRKDT